MWRQRWVLPISSSLQNSIAWVHKLTLAAWPWVSLPLSSTFQSLSVRELSAVVVYILIEKLYHHQLSSIALTRQATTNAACMSRTILAKLKCQSSRSQDLKNRRHWRLVDSRIRPSGRYISPLTRYHRLRGSASTVLTATGQVNGR